MTYERTRNYQPVEFRPGLLRSVVARLHELWFQSGVPAEHRVAFSASMTQQYADGTTRRWKLSSADELAAIGRFLSRDDPSLTLSYLLVSDDKYAVPRPGGAYWVSFQPSSDRLAVNVEAPDADAFHAATVLLEQELGLQLWVDPVPEQMAALNAATSAATRTAAKVASRREPPDELPGHLPSAPPDTLPSERSAPSLREEEPRRRLSWESVGGIVGLVALLYTIFHDQQERKERQQEQQEQAATHAALRAVVSFGPVYPKLRPDTIPAGPLGDLARLALPGVDGYWHARVENTGKRKAVGVSLVLPWAGYACVTLADEAIPRCGTVTRTVPVGTLQPREAVTVTAWTGGMVPERRHLSDALLTYDEGVGSVELDSSLLVPPPPGPPPAEPSYFFRFLQIVGALTIGVLVVSIATGVPYTFHPRATGKRGDD